MRKPALALALPVLREYRGSIGAAHTTAGQGAGTRDVERPQARAFVMEPALLTTIVALPVSLISYAALRAARSARRNRHDRCGNCGGPLYAPGSLSGPSLLQGHLVCGPCAAKERRMLGGSLIAAGTITGVAVLTLAAVAIRAPAELGSHPWLPAVATALTYPALFGGAIAWMKRLNRRAAQRLGLQPGSPGPPVAIAPGRKEHLR